MFCFHFDLKTFELEKIFTTNDHVGKLKDLHIISNHHLVTSGEDENVKVYDIKKNEKLSNIFGIDGVTTKLLSSNKYILAGTEKGKLSVIG